MNKKFFGLKSKNFRPGSKKFTVILWVVTFAAIGGVLALYLTQAAQPLVLDNTIPQPRNVQVFPDDQSLYIRWDQLSTDNMNYGYYLKYKRRGAPDSTAIVRQTMWNSIQLQPLENNVDYDITVQTARGSWWTVPVGPLNHPSASQTQAWFRANGSVSPAVSVSGKPSSARVDAMRTRLTGFFDDFNEPANPINELKWNSATTGRSGTNSNGTFINPQFHAHTQLNSGFGGIINRPRATFNTPTGLNGGPLSESNPARIEWDMDMGYDSRSNWYLDLIPLSTRRNKQILDINAHDQNDVERGDEPGNMLRVNVSGFVAEFEYWDSTFQLQKLNVRQGNVVCNGDTTGANLYWGGCDLSRKTSGLSPLPELSEPIWVGPQNVRRHFIMELTPTKVRLFVDSALLIESNLPADLAREVTQPGRQEFTLHNAMFTYNTGKGWDLKTSPYTDLRLHTLLPKTHFYHWDNFGFTGPAPSTVAHNYIDGGADGKTPNYFKGEEDQIKGRRTTIIPIPDDIGSPVGGKAKLYFQEWGSAGPYKWASGDHVVVNGRRYDISNPLANMVGYPPEYADSLGSGGRVHTLMVEVNASDLVKGNNTITSNIQGSAAPASFSEPHIELEYAKGTQPQYTPPLSIFGQAFSNIVEPRMTNCDQWIYIEQDLGLPYQEGKANMNIGDGACANLDTTPHHTGYNGSGVPLPTPDTTAPTVSITAPANNATVSNNTIQAAANATDNTGINRVEFQIGGITRATDTTAPYQVDLDFTSLAAGTYAVRAIAYDTAGNSATTSAIQVTKPQPADTTAPTVVLSSPVNSYAVPSGTNVLALSANVTDSVGVTRVEFYIDNALVATKAAAVSGSTYEHSFNPGSLQAGTHQWRVQAYEAAGNERVTETRSFTTPTSPAPDPSPEPTPDPLPEPIPTPRKVGDINGDGKVSFADLALLLANYGKSVPANQNGDLNGSGTVTFADLALLLSNYGK